MSSNSLKSDPELNRSWNTPFLTPSSVKFATAFSTRVGLRQGILGVERNQTIEQDVNLESNVLKSNEKEDNSLDKDTNQMRNSSDSYSKKEVAPRRSHEVEQPKIVDPKLTQEAQMLSEIARLNTMSIRFTKFKCLIDSPTIDLGKFFPCKELIHVEKLRKLSWSGIPDEVRSITWKLLLGYIPLNIERREATLARKRKEYEDLVAQSFVKGIQTIDQQLHHQIDIDVQRTHSGIALYQDESVREALKRILYCWAIRHPASGYVQGINDLPLEINIVAGAVETADLSKISPSLISQVEADTFWCLTKLLDGIQDNYTFAQPGIQRQVSKLKELIGRIDVPLATHLQQQGIEFIQFAFRWMNCLLMREVNLKSTIRMWDTYMAEGQDGFSDFHLYVCAAFLVKWSDRLRKMEFAEILMFIQGLPVETQTWEEKDIELLLSEAFMWKSLFHNSPGHLPS